MLVTTARKPCARTRTLARRVARFLCSEFLTRGKASLDEISGDRALVIGDIKGNPGSLVFYVDGREVLSMRFTLAMCEDFPASEKPVIPGEGELAEKLAGALGIGRGNGARAIRVDDSRMEFLDRGEPVVVMKLLSVRLDCRV
ncbi:MAG TPA: hypothetical protein HA257_01245 [Candidatus Methanoperedenaceae archaeon]|nr:hypothetical protein [Candidatus Methanoperedenaceae archaeon]